MSKLSSPIVLNGRSLRSTGQALMLAALCTVALRTVAGSDDHAGPPCVRVGGAFVTNFIAPDQTAARPSSKGPPSR